MKTTFKLFKEDYKSFNDYNFDELKDNIKEFIKDFDGYTESIYYVVGIPLKPVTNHNAGNSLILNALFNGDTILMRFRINYKYKYDAKESPENIIQYLEQELPDFDIEFSDDSAFNIYKYPDRYNVSFTIKISAKNWVKRSIKSNLWDLKEVYGYLGREWSIDDDDFDFDGFILNCSFDDIKKYLDEGGDINRRDGDGDTILVSSVNTGRINEVKYLLNNGADITNVNNKGENILYWLDEKRYSNIDKREISIYLINYILDNYSEGFITEHFPNIIEYFKYASKENYEKYKHLLRGNKAGLWDLKKEGVNDWTPLENIFGKYNFIDIESEICEFLGNNNISEGYFNYVLLPPDTVGPKFSDKYYLNSTGASHALSNGNTVNFEFVLKFGPLVEGIVEGIWNILKKRLSEEDFTITLISSSIKNAAQEEGGYRKEFAFEIKPHWLQRAKRSGLWDLKKESKEIDWDRVLYDASFYGDLFSMEKALKNGADINSIIYEDTALIQAVYNGNLEAVKFLLKHKADPFLKVEGGMDATPIEVAEEVAQHEILEYLTVYIIEYYPDRIKEIEKFVSDDIKEKYSDTFRAFKAGLWDSIIKESNEDWKFFEVGEVVICIRNEEASELTLGKEYKIKAIFAVMLQIQEDDGIYRWKEVRRFKYPEGYRRSKKSGLWDLKKESRVSKEEWSDLLLLYCREGGTLEQIKYAVENGADVNYLQSLPNWISHTPITYAAYSGEIEIVKYLIEAGAIINHKTVQWASISGFKEIADLLMYHFLKHNPEKIKKVEKFMTPEQKQKYKNLFRSDKAGLWNFKEFENNKFFTFKDDQIKEDIKVDSKSINMIGNQHSEYIGKDIIRYVKLYFKIYKDKLNGIKTICDKLQKKLLNIPESLREYYMMVYVYYSLRKNAGWWCSVIYKDLVSEYIDLHVKNHIINLIEENLKKKLEKNPSMFIDLEECLYNPNNWSRGKDLVHDSIVSFFNRIYDNNKPKWKERSDKSGLWDFNENKGTNFSDEQDIKKSK
jgi:ankyrin repeat protein